MKRKGGRVVSAGTTSVSAVVAPTSPVTDAAQTSVSRPAEQPLPSIDVFSRFQSHRDDFDADWIMAREDPADAVGVTFDPAVAHKLKLHQSRLDALRTGASASTANRTTTTTSSSAATRTSPSSAPKATKPMHVDASLDAAAAANNEYRAARKAARRPPALSITDSDEGERDMGRVRRDVHADEDDDETEYNPEEVAVVIKAAPIAMAPATDHAVTVVSDEEEAVVATEKTDEGLQGDYLSFIAATHGAKSLDASALQATVNVSAAPTAQEGDRARGGEDRQRQGNAHTNAKSSHAASSSPMTVPLWSVERMERHGGYCASNELVAVHQEVMDLVDYLRPTRAEVSIRRYLEREVGRLAKKLWPESEIIVYGSLYTHLLLPLSDVDMTLVNVPVPQEEALTLLAKEISQADLCETAYPQVILKTKVPLVKFEHKGSLVPVDISVDATDGKVNSDIVIRLLQLYPQAQPLTTVLKYFLQQRGMDEPYHGGLGSYATTLLVISFLQNHPIYTTNPEQRATTGLGKLLVDFFRYYGLYWNFHRCGISVEDGGRNFYRDQFSSPTPSSPTGRGPQGPTQAVIEDPANSANNAASSLRMLHVIASLFAHAYQSLTLNLRNEVPHAATELSPDAAEITHRPTVLSRIMHVDAETVYRRQRIATAYASLCEALPEEMQAVEAYRSAEDEPMLTGRRARRQVVGELKGAGTGVGGAPRVTSAERVTLASLRAAAAKCGTDGEDETRYDATRRKRRRSDGTSSSSSSSDSPSSSSGGSSRSNASSVRGDVSHRTQQRRRLESQSKWKR